MIRTIDRIKPRGIKALSMVLGGVFLILGTTGTPSAQEGQEEMTPPSAGVVLIYHRFGEGDYPSTNTQIAQLEAHIDVLNAPDAYQIMRLDALLDARRSGTTHTRPTVAISVDDAYKSVITEAWPRLKAAGIPLAVFVATDPIDAGNPNYMTWGDLRQLAAEGVYIGHHGASHAAYLDLDDAAVIQDIEKANTRFKAELGTVPRIFAWPFGEYDARLLGLIQDMGFEHAFAQFSAPLPVTGDDFALPRFPINEQYGELDRFRLVTRSLPLALADVLPTDSILNQENNPPSYGFTLLDPPSSLETLSCYPSHLGQAADLEVIEGDRVEVRFDRPFPTGRNRINCTMPAGNGRWFWIGKFFMVPN